MASAELQTAIQMLRDNPPIQGDTLLEMRSSMQAAVANLPRPHDVECETVDAGGVPAEWVRAPGSRGDRALIHLHGGGYVMGSLDSHRGLAAHLSRSTRAPVLLADYRLAPENPYPAAVEDGVAAYRHVVRSGTDPGRIAISGDSAGGGLTVATLVALRDEGDALPAAGVCISPWLDLTQSGESFRTKVDEDHDETAALARHGAACAAQLEDLLEAGSSTRRRQPPTVRRGRHAAPVGRSDSATTGGGRSWSTCPTW